MCCSISVSIGFRIFSLSVSQPTGDQKSGPDPMLDPDPQFGNHSLLMKDASDPTFLPKNAAAASVTFRFDS